MHQPHRGEILVEKLPSLETVKPQWGDTKIEIQTKVDFG